MHQGLLDMKEYLNIGQLNQYKVIEIIHSADPQLLLVVIIIFAHVVRTCSHFSIDIKFVLENITKQILSKTYNY